jgi:hypothetical protein
MFIMKRPIAFIAGLIILIGTLLSLFLEPLGWYNYNFTGLILPDNAYWIGSLGGLNWAGEMQNLTNDDSALYLIPGGLAALGGLLLLIQSRSLGILSGLLVLTGVGVFLYNISQMDVIEVIIDAGGNMWWWEGTVPLVGDYVLRIGYGLMVTAAGGILGILGSLPKKD